MRISFFHIRRLKDGRCNADNPDGPHCGRTLRVGEAVRKCEAGFAGMRDCDGSGRHIAHDGGARPGAWVSRSPRDGVLRYNTEGFAGLADRLRGGSENRLTEAQIDEVRACVTAGSDLERDDVTRWRVEDIMGKIKEAFRVLHTESGVRKLLQRIGFRHVSPRAVYPEAEIRRQKTFVKAFKALLAWTLSLDTLAGELEIRFQDEARVGRKGMTTRVRAPRGHRPRIVRDLRCKCVYLFGATCAQRSVGIAHVTDNANTASMNEHLASISAAVAPGRTRRGRARRRQLASCERSRRSRQPDARASAAPQPGTQSDGANHSAPEIEPVCRSQVQGRRRHQECLPIGLELADRPTRCHYANRPAKPGRRAIAPISIPRNTGLFEVRLAR